MKCLRLQLLIVQTFEIARSENWSLHELYSEARLAEVFLGSLVPHTSSQTVIGSIVYEPIVKLAYRICVPSGTDQRLHISVCSRQLKLYFFTSFVISRK